MSQAQPDCGIPPSTAYKDFAELKEWNPDDPASYVRAEIRVLAKHARELFYSPQSNVGNVFRENEPKTRAKSKGGSAPDNKQDLEEERFWAKVYHNSFLGAMVIFLDKHLTEYLLHTEKLVALCTAESVTTAIIYSTKANLPPQADAKAVFDKTMQEAFSKHWCVGYRLIADIYTPLLQKIGELAKNNKSIIPLEPELVERHRKRLALIPDDDPLCYV